MGAASQKKRLMGLPVRQAKKRFLEIWREANPSEDFETKHGKVWAWMECWLRLRSINSSYDDVCEAFAEKIAKANKHNHELEEKISRMKGEIHKKQRRLEELNGSHDQAHDSQAETVGLPSELLP